MKINPDFVLRTVAGKHIVVPIGEAGVSFNGVITLNDSGKMLFEMLVKGAEPKDLVNRLMEVYDVSQEQANEDVKAFIETLASRHVLA